jgi:hypothetical protein
MMGYHQPMKQRLEDDPYGKLSRASGPCRAKGVALKR